MGKSLFLCNTVYQVLVAVWLKCSLFNDKNTDIIISNHMNGFQDVAQNIRSTGAFEKVYTVESKEYVKGINESTKKQVIQCFKLAHADKEISKFMALDDIYDEVFVANFDFFADLLFNALKVKNKNLKFSIFEDGISTYCRSFENGYKRCFLARFIKHFVGAYVMYGNLSECYVFNPDLMDWKPCEKITKVPKIDDKNIAFIEKINTIFGYDQLEDTYKEKYIFFEEAFYADTGYMEDVELVERIAEVVGKENLFIKIHPRNPENRFEKTGYKTNKNTVIPWEVIAMNTDISNKVLFTIGSASVLNTATLLEKKCQCFSFINCLSERPAVLKTELGDKILTCFEYNKNIKIIDKEMWV